MTQLLRPTNLLNRSLELPCGAVIKKRLMKSAMSDSLADGEGNPTHTQSRLYERWAEGGIGLSIVGEVQVDSRFPEKPGNLVLTEHSNLKDLQMLTSRASINNAHIWPQLGHAGGLAYKPLSDPKGPSPIKIGEFECAGMSEQEISLLPDIYAKAAKIAKKAGFTGVQIHAGHGFLLSQFLSPLFNHRQDQYGGSIESRSKIIMEIIEKVRCAVGPTFPIGIKMNSSDQLEGGLTQDDALEVIGILNQTSIDLIEISGGSYFPGAKSSSDSASSGPYFVDFAVKARKLTSIPLVVTGGFKTYDQVISALSLNAVDSIGLGRALILNPELPNEWIDGSSVVPRFPKFKLPPVGGVTAWYTMLLTAIGSENEKEFNLELLPAIQAYESRDKARVSKWLAKYPF
ncbi:2,4-dienoyl-CoA reductase-like NADH-dependent reductase (Old Yellow Enzyme family) [Vibrio crassostreae]|uniref:NADH:flavin oxidoreductase/NADH oxidase family protein n=1 Tax=Vibrio crassostreae TaxID=246167 RepID=UPI001044C111|nr:NADH:flavin oxidoreductase/NADH oxidase family protein [Vibrio crassostreae]TCN81587.1 2,4-dienoyl-CoA reductase-like NADH-dependent reductase (Old Yellow Enzyme family) [Vibrio crassostreae]CAK2460036.1 2,4-dienoyl-CoA reductase-like NADH-dependent reductase (Old Yellow Enzyme family) [Vibrio crassostreae]CAK2466852.1 2,4-dienoyl-CoA reductase-like NADH-dependent reductase (Old Yellow Enzyme family) [Vibrio crassostreae]CAK3758388.1 2,4-dienoyl-CoA reductase-like NADH-dependent reductase (O